MEHVASVDERVFAENPSFRRGIVVAWGLDNAGASPELEAALAEAIARAAASPLDLKADARIVPWLEAHRRFGSNPNKFPPAHLSLLKRIQKPGAQLPAINKVVTIMNLCSILNTLPVGGDDLAATGATLTLRVASGAERFAPLDAPDTIEHPEPGEVVYVVQETGEVMCRRWNWRNGYATRITETTVAMLMNVDGLGDGCEARTLAARDMVADLLARHCGARTLTGLLSPEAPSLSFSI